MKIIFHLIAIRYNKLTFYNIKFNTIIKIVLY